MIDWDEVQNAVSYTRTYEELSKRLREAYANAFALRCFHPKPGRELENSHRRAQVVTG